MAVNSFDDILNSLVGDADDREVLGSLASKYPEIKQGWLRQADYSRKLDSFRDTEKKVEAWNKWAADNWDTENNAPKMEVFWRNKAHELESQVNTDMTFDEIFEIFRQIKKDQAPNFNLRHYVFTGGEPLVQRTSY